ncbi:MAG TPA: PhzF family phenazine biosynthesis protein [Azoarcus taiwanensis]|nr:PhzF family phenazine biosynthesis protein [Azoarcus taiwanensis]
MNELLRFSQLDVFTDRPLLGNPVAVVHDAEGLDDAEMAAFARWTNLSETTFLLPPTQPGADYRLRIFTPGGELPFAGHPTLGSCRAWLDAGGTPGDGDAVVQECAVGLVRIRRTGERLAFAAPPLRRRGPMEATELAQVAAVLGLSAGEIVAHQWVDNGPGWCAVMLGSAERVLGLQPDWAAMGDLRVGVVAPQPDGADTDFEVRAFIPAMGIREDPVTGSLNAGLAQWMIAAGLSGDRYVARQGTALGRAGNVYVERLGDTIWIGGDVVACVSGSVRLR